MKRLATTLIAICLTMTLSAQIPDTLLHSIPAPPVGVQSSAKFGSSVAVDAGLTLVGVPSDAWGENNSGTVKVFNSTSGALLFTLINPSPAANDNFGISVAISGTRVVIGAYQDDTGATNCGSAYIYDLSGATPTVPVLTLNNPAPNSNDYFGYAVAISGTRVVVGAYQDDTGASDAGSAYVYDLTSGTPAVPVMTLNKSTPASSDNFGYSVAISGTRVVVGANGDDAGGFNSGSAHVYDLSGATPLVPVALLSNPSPAAFDVFGVSVAIFGTQVVVGADHDDTGASDAGSAYVYDLGSGTPAVPVLTLNHPSPVSFEQFGHSVAISGTRVVVGAYTDDTGASSAGSTYVYDLSGGSPTAPIATLNNPSPVLNGYFGISVAISGTRVAVGTPSDSTGSTVTGKAYLYELSSGTLTVPLQTLSAPGPSAADLFGWSVAISGTWMVVGALWEDTGAVDTGSAYVYDLAGATPTVPVFILNNPSPASSDYFGNSVAISGTRVVVGAFQDDTGIANAGSAYVYDLSGPTPTVPVMTLNNPSPAAADAFGQAVAISGTQVVVGTAQDNTGASDAGSVYIYDLSSGTPSVPVSVLNNPSPVAGDYFGDSVAISGTRVVVGASQDDAGAGDAGSAYVYDLSSGTPTVPVLTLNNPGPAASDYFGNSVAISGTKLVVGAYQDDTGASNAGSAYVYDLLSGTPTVPVTILNNPSPAVDNRFGVSVAISAMRAVVGAYQDDTGASNAGSAFVYDLASGTPSVAVATLNNPGPEVGEQFGFAVAIDGTTVAIGTPNDDSPQADKGGAYVFGPAAPGIAVTQDDPLSDGTGIVPFGSVPVDSSSVPFSFTITNSGAADLTSLVVNKDGLGAADFAVSALSATSIPVGAGTATFTVTFSPSAVGTRTAALHIASNVTGTKNPFDITLTGTGVSTNANLSSLSLSDGTLTPAFAMDTTSYTASVPHTITTLTVSPVKAEPLASVQVRVNGGSYSIPGSPLALIVGTNTVEVLVTAQDGITTKTYTVTVTRAEGPEIAIRGNSVEIANGDSTPNVTDDTYFGPVAIASGMITRTFTISNTGVVTLNLTGTPRVSLSGAHAADYHVSLMPNSPVAASSSTAFQVTFDPSTIGLRTAVVSIESDDLDETPYTFAISGAGRIASQVAQTLVFTPPAKLYLAESPFTLGATTNSGLPVVYTVISGPATVSGNVLTLTGTGTVKLRASQPGNADFLAATPVERTITVAANPTMLTLTNLSQTYTGTPRAITVLGATGSVEVTYQVGLFSVPTPPTNVGSYPLKAVAGGVTKTGTLVITKAPLFVQPDDQRKFAGQANPVLGFGYSGFLGSDIAANSVSKAPVIATTATATSVGGNYPITASGGTSANYQFVYLKGAMRVETFAASYEALLVDAGTQRPSAKLELTVAASSKTFTAKLTTPTETAAVALNGTLGAPSLNETATGTATVKKGANTYVVNVTLPLIGDFTAEAKLNGNPLGTATNGRKLLTLATGQTLSYIGTHSALLAPATAGAGVPAGAGWAVATIDAKGLLKLTGKLADGTGLTASLPADVSSNPGYRLFLQPYTPARTGTFIAGAFTLKPQLDPGLTGRRYVAFEDATDLTWAKAPRLLDTSYRAGFGPVSTRFTLDPWLPPVPAKGIIPAITLTQRLGLTANQFTAQHSAISSASFINLPTILGLNATTNVVSVSVPLANATKWKVTLTPATGAFVGSFELTDAGKKRPVPFTGIMRQPPLADLSGLIGDGNFQLPALTPAPNNEVLSGEIGFER